MIFNFFNLVYAITDEAHRSVLTRNRHMYTILNENPVQKGNKRYVFGGLGHFAVLKHHKEKGIDISPDQDSFLIDKKFAILIPRDRKVLGIEPEILNFP